MFNLIDFYGIFNLQGIKENRGCLRWRCVHGLHANLLCSHLQVILGIYNTETIYNCFLVRVKNSHRIMGKCWHPRPTWVRILLLNMRTHFRSCRSALWEPLVLVKLVYILIHDCFCEYIYIYIYIHPIAAPCNFVILCHLFKFIRSFNIQ